MKKLQSDSSKWTKLIIRRLPPCLNEEDFKLVLDEKWAGKYNWFSFFPGKINAIRTIYSRAYINLNNPKDALNFKKKFNGYVFIGSRGTQYKCIVQYSPFQKIPIRKVKRDPAIGTVYTDPFYIKFKKELEKKPEALPSAQRQYEIKMALKKEEKEEKVITPLMQCVIDKYSNDISKNNLMKSQFRKMPRQDSYFESDIEIKVLLVNYNMDKFTGDDIIRGIGENISKNKLLESNYDNKEVKCEKRILMENEGKHKMSEPLKIHNIKYPCSSGLSKRHHHYHQQKNKNIKKEEEKKILKRNQTDEIIGCHFIDDPLNDNEKKKSKSKCNKKNRSRKKKLNKTKKKKEIEDDFTTEKVYKRILNMQRKIKIQEKKVTEQLEFINKNEMEIYETTTTTDDLDDEYCHHVEENITQEEITTENGYSYINDNETEKDDISLKCIDEISEGINHRKSIWASLAKWGSIAIACILTAGIFLSKNNKISELNDDVNCGIMHLNSDSNLINEKLETFSIEENIDDKDEIIEGQDGKKEDNVIVGDEELHTASIIDIANT